MEGHHRSSNGGSSSGTSSGAMEGHHQSSNGGSSSGAMEGHHRSSNGGSSSSSGSGAMEGHHQSSNGGSSSGAMEGHHQSSNGGSSSGAMEGHHRSSNGGSSSGAMEGHHLSSNGGSSSGAMEGHHRSSNGGSSSGAMEGHHRSSNGGSSSGAMEGHHQSSNGGSSSGSSSTAMEGHHQSSNECSSSTNVSPDSCESTVELNIKTSDSRIYSFQVERKMAVSLLKEKIANEIGVAVNLQRLIFRGQFLKDELVLSEYHVENGHTLHLVQRLPNPSQTSATASVETTTTNSNPGTDAGSGAPRNRVGQISHSVVLGTFNVREQLEGTAQDLTTAPILGADLAPQHGIEQGEFDLDDWAIGRINGVQQNDSTWWSFISFAAGSVRNLPPTQHQFLLMLFVGILSVLTRTCATQFFESFQVGKITYTYTPEELFYAFFLEVAHITGFIICWIITFILIFPLQHVLQLFFGLLCSAIIYFVKLKEKTSASGVHVACGDSFNLPLFWLAIIHASGFSLIIGSLVFLIFYLSWRFIHQENPRAVEVSLQISMGKLLTFSAISYLAMGVSLQIFSLISSLIFDEGDLNVINCHHHHLHVVLFSL